MSDAFTAFLDERRQHINHYLDQRLRATGSESAAEQRLVDAMRYSTLDGGKRARAVLVYLCAKACEADTPARNCHSGIDTLAAAIECIHAYSLIHDDLPAMDDDDIRRGKPSNHRKFDEATAILAGDALQSFAFQLIAEETTLNPSQRCEAISVLGQASGHSGMVGGQAIDLGAVDQQIDLEQLAHMHNLKTGALISVCASLAAIGCEANANTRDALERYAKAIGLAFQVHDDILDVEGDSTTLGKQSGADSARNKPTYPALLGLNGAKQESQRLLNEALTAIEPLGDKAQDLKRFAQYLVNRQH